VFAGIVVFQPLPFASSTSFEKIPDREKRREILAKVREKGIVFVAQDDFGAVKEKCVLKAAKYRCHCSRDYLKGVLVSLGEKEFRNIVKEDGAVSVHCHYCNTDYSFTELDADDIFKKN
jgi:molecular chaperone Hsp33